ncbi:MAG: DUF2179 domain-containing protein [Syntrophotaleaceae bacterium]
MSFLDPGTYSLVLLPLLVFLARIIDVSIGTLRIIFVARSLKGLAATLGFFESLIWILAISQVMQNLTNFLTYIAFALGFAAGNYCGVLIEERIALGNLIIRIITRKEATELVSRLWEAGYGVTSLEARGETGPVQLIFTVCRRRDLKDALGMIRQFNPKAFYTIEDVRFVQENVPAGVRHRHFLRRLGLRMRK